MRTHTERQIGATVAPGTAPESELSSKAAAKAPATRPQVGPADELRDDGLKAIVDEQESAAVDERQKNALQGLGPLAVDD